MRIYLVILFCFDFLIKFSTSENRIFYWEGDNLVQPENLSDESLEYRYLPVIEGEVVELTCTVRAISKKPYTVNVYHEGFNANKTEKREEIDGDKYVKEVITVNNDNSAAIDEKEILCEIYEPFEDTISLLTKAYIIDRIPVSAQTCKDCEGNVPLTIRKASNQKKEEAKLEEGLKNKLKNEYVATAVDIDSNGIVSADVSFNTIRRKIHALSQGGPGWTVNGTDVQDIDTFCDCVKEEPYTEGGVNEAVIVIVIVLLVAVCAVCGLGFIKYRRNNSDREIEMENVPEEGIELA